MSLRKIEILLKDTNIGIDSWYECYLDEVVSLFKPLIQKGEIDDCFMLLEKLTKEEQVKFFEAITEVETIELIPRLLNVLKTAEREIAEPIIDGLRCWKLKQKDLESLKKNSKRFYGTSKVLDKILDNLLNEA